MPTKFLKPTHDLKTANNLLDCRPAREVIGKELYDLINASIAKDQMFVQHELPCYLVVTQKQFASLNGYTEEMHHTTDRLFKSMGTDGTIQCIMEVVIDRDLDTVDEIEAGMQMIDKMNEESKVEKVAPPPFMDGIIPM